MWLLSLKAVASSFSVSPDSVKIVSEADAWKLIRQPGVFAPAGWEHPEVPSLTRVQAVRMGLEVNEYVDERFDPVKGKAAAARYYGYSLEGKQELAALVGEGGSYLLADLADEAHVPLRIIEAANPHLRRDILPEGVALYGVTLNWDADKATALAEKQSAYQNALVAQYEKRRQQVMSFMPDPSTHSVVSYTVRSGDYLGRISAKTGASVEDIQKWNGLRGNTIYPGQKLTVWVPKSAAAEVNTDLIAGTEEKPTASSPTTTSAPSSVIAEAQPSGAFITYEVKPGDTLWGIAQKFPGVSAENIKSWNRIDELIKAGEKLRIHTETITDYSPDKYPSAL